MHTRRVLASALACLVGCAASPPPSSRAVTASTAAATPTQRRGLYARELLGVIGRGAPEQIGYLGLPGFDDAVTDVSLAADERDARDLLAAAEHFANLRSAESDPDARIDLVILEDAARRFASRTQLSTRLTVRFTDVAQTLYQGLTPLFAVSATPAKHTAGERRLRRYLGDGGPPLVDAAIARIRSDIAAHKLAPTKAEVRTLLENIPSLRDALVHLVDVNSHDNATQLGAGLDRWRQFVENELLPAARDDFRLPPEIYAMNLRDAGMDDDPAALVTRAHAAYDRTMAEWRTLAQEVATEHHWPDATPLGVLAVLKREHQTGAALQALFEQRIVDVERTIRREHIVTLPTRPVLFRPATAAETALNPSPSIDVQGFLSGAHEIAILMPGAPAPGSPPYDDFTYDAAIWPLLVHEGRPGHEMQFTTAVAHGMSPARTLFAFNAANAEGWALYSEEVMRPFMPKESRFVALQYLLFREARAFLDPGLHAGRVTIEEARRVLHDELGASTALTDAEVRRYTFGAPGQATAYFFGLEKIERLRDEVQHALGPRFELVRFNDAILNQGFAPLAIVAAGVKRELGIPVARD